MKKLKVRVSFVLLFLVFSVGCAQTPMGIPESVMAKRIPPSTETTWALSGYLAEKPSEKVYVTILGNRITEVSPNKPKLPAKAILETTATIFPGFLDLRNRPNTASSPLWPEARAQWSAKRDWERPFAQYQGNRTGIEKICASQRWAQIKAAAGGTTLIQGSSMEEYDRDLEKNCARNFALSFVENPGDLDQTVAISYESLLPSGFSPIFETYFSLEIKKGISYKDAYLQMLEKNRVPLWLKHFQEEPHILANAFYLLLGRTFDFSLGQLSLRDFENAETRIRAFLAGPPYSLSEMEIQIQMDRMREWIFGETGSSFLKSDKEASTALKFLTKEAVLTIPAPIRHYISAFEMKVRERTLKHLEEVGPRLVFSPLSEDTGSSHEFQNAASAGLIREGLIVQGGLSLSNKDLTEMAKKKIPFVWTPFSDLALYGKTINPKTLLDLGIVVALGTGGGALGSKNLLDEMKAARIYLDSKKITSITNQQLVEMATLGGARALGMGNQLGRISNGNLAYLTLIHCQATKNVYDCALQADLRDVRLVVSNGHGTYGDVDLIESLAEIFGDENQPEILPTTSKKVESKCAFQKALRLKNGILRDKKNGVPPYLRTLRELKTIQEFAGANQKPLPVDGILDCEDKMYGNRRNALLNSLFPKQKNGSQKNTAH